METRRKQDKLKVGVILGCILTTIGILAYIVVISTTAAEVRIDAKVAHMWVEKNQSLPIRVEAVEAKCEKYDKVADSSLRVEGKIDTILNELNNMNRRLERVENKIDNNGQ